ncbi:hypothetical protein CABS02_15352 [Colletotrichum abscissum]|uniref:Chromo domain-containing protein n=1 Tax=Colletotrichum abscissum TaxID=1671311 RepID=A0A9Q0AWP8_9PEZI|nr:hypothetical protein CABS02_15352 [Colletotrichum abscissum]
MVRERASVGLAQPESAADFYYGAIDQIVAHTLDPNTTLVTLTVLAKGLRSDVAEWDIQEHRPTLLYNYWTSFEGKTLLVQWLGYTDEGEDVSWEPAAKIRADAPDVLMDYCRYVKDDGVNAALLGPMARMEAYSEVKNQAEEIRSQAAALTIARRPAKRIGDSVAEPAKSPIKSTDAVTSRHGSTPGTPHPLPGLSVSKRRQSQAPNGDIQPQPTPRSAVSTTRRLSFPTHDTENAGASPSPALRPLSPRNSTREASVEPATSIDAQNLRTTVDGRTMLWFMDDFTVADMQKVCRFVDEHCTGKLRLPLYSGGDWDGQAASGRWENIFAVSPLGRSGKQV